MVYKKFAEEYMALPVLAGIKTESEKFAGAVETYAIEGLMQDRRALQAGTSHNLGQNFAKAFEVTFQSREGGLEYVWATSWGVSTRLVGALIMTHSDDKGLVLPPALAPTEILIVPIFKNESRAQVMEFARRLQGLLSETRSVELDDDEQNSPGYRFAEAELRGVPLRIEVGPRDVAQDQVVLVRRDTGEKLPVPSREVPSRAAGLLQDIQQNLYRRALEFRKAHTHAVDDYDSFKRIIEVEGGFVESPWCGAAACEARIKDDTKATIRVLPLGRSAPEGKSCLLCGEKANELAVFARAY
jgi:prolyl-tRNA synthetase